MKSMELSDTVDFELARSAAIFYSSLFLSVECGVGRVVFSLTTECSEFADDVSG